MEASDQRGVMPLIMQGGVSLIFLNFATLHILTTGLAIALWYVLAAVEIMERPWVIIISPLFVSVYLLYAMMTVLIMWWGLLTLCGTRISPRRRRLM